MSHRLLRVCLWLAVWVPGCTCAGLDGEEGPVPYVRCANARPPEVDSHVGPLRLRVEARRLRVEGAARLRLAAFTGPVGAPLGANELDALKAAAPGLVLWLGGLGDDLPAAQASLAAAGSLGVPVLFVAGGADRLELVDEAFDELEAPLRDRLLHISGLRQLQLGDRDTLAVLSGAPLGRYALDDEACGFGPSDVRALAASLEDRPSGRLWLLSWAAPSGWGLSLGMGAREVGSPDLHALAATQGFIGGLFAYPEARAGAVLRDERTRGLRAVVPRLGPSGSARHDRSRGAGGLLVLEWGPDGLTPASAVAPPPRAEVSRRPP